MLFRSWIAAPGGRPSLDWYCHCAVLPASPARLAALRAQAGPGPGPVLAGPGQGSRQEAPGPLLLLDERFRRSWFGDAPLLGQASGLSLVRVQERSQADSAAQKN